MLSIVRLECEEYQRFGPCRLLVHLSDGGMLKVAVEREALRSFDLFQRAVVQQIGIWVHHPSETGRSADRLEWKRMIREAFGSVAGQS